MKLTTMTQVTVDGLMQGNGSAEEEDRCRNPRSVSPDHARNRRRGYQITITTEQGGNEWLPTR